MAILTRKPGQALTVYQHGQPIAVVRVVEIRGEQVMLDATVAPGMCLGLHKSSDGEQADELEPLYVDIGGESGAA